MELYVEYLGKHSIEKKYKLDVGVDLYTHIPKENTTGKGHILLFPGQVATISTGLKVAMPLDYWAEVVPRSSSLIAWGIYVQPGIIDPGYTGEVYIVALNVSTTLTKIEDGRRIAQLIVHPRVDMKIVECNSVEDKYKEMMGEQPQRGTNGLGSTGTS